MWMLVWRPLVIVLALVGLGETALVAAVVPKNPFAADLLMNGGWLMLVLQGLGSLALLVAGVWGPLRRIARRGGAVGS